MGLPCCYATPFLASSVGATTLFARSGGVGGCPSSRAKHHRKGWSKRPPPSQRSSGSYFKIRRPADVVQQPQPRSCCTSYCGSHRADRRAHRGDRSTGYLKAVWLKIFGPVFLGSRPKIDPGTPLDRPGAPRTSICTKNQPRRPILRPFRDNSGV